MAKETKKSKKIAAEKVTSENKRLADLKKAADEKRWDSSNMTSSERDIKDAGK